MQLFKLFKRFVFSILFSKYFRNQTITNCFCGCCNFIPFLKLIYSLKMDSFCRLCLESDSYNSFSLFTTKVGDEITVGDLYKTISNISFKNWEDLNGSKICESCLVKVCEFKNFRDTLIHNNITVLKLRIRKFFKLI